MRTTVDIDDDVLQAAKEIPRHEKKTAGRVISELARKALFDGAPATPESEWDVLPRSRGRIVTNKLIKQLMEQADEEDFERAMGLAESKR